MSRSEIQHLDRFLKSIPKTDTHLHIEGGLPYHLLVDLDDARFPPSPFFLNADYQFPSFVEFENLLIEHAVTWFESAERYHIACKQMFANMLEQNIRYVETSFHLQMIEFIKTDGPEIISAIKSAVPDGMEVRIIGGMVRNGYSEAMKPIIEDVHTWEELDGIDMHGQEWLDLEDWAPRVWKRCRDAGKIVKVHAGEFGGPEKIYEALDLLGSKRIQHGVRACEDPALVERLANEGVVLDVCPLSNVKLKVFENLKRHSLPDLVKQGVCCTINTDDPMCFGNDLLSEYRALYDQLGFTIDELGELAKNGFIHADLDESLKNHYIAEIDSAVAL